MKKSRVGGVCLLVSAFTACAAPTERVDPELGVESDEIINGTTAITNYFAVAVYHKDGGVWFQRPCTGTLMGTEAGVAYILTAYHCVNEIGGSPSNIRLTTTLNPGRLTGTPPSSWVTPTGLVFAPNAVANDAAKDFALITVADSASLRSGLSPTGVEDRANLFFGNSSDLKDRSLRAYGYGRATLCTSANDDPNHSGVDCLIEDPNSGVGRLRLGSGFTVLTSTTPSYNYSMPTGAGAKIYSGDSGGPSTAFFINQTPTPPDGDDNYQWRIFTGVHVNVSTLTNPTQGWDASSPAVPEFLQSQVGYVYASSAYSPTTMLRRNTTSSGSTVNATSFTADSRSRWTYLPSTTKQLKSGSYCLVGSSTNNSNVTVTTCSNASSQQWTHTKDLQLRNVGTGLCLAYTGTNVQNKTCSVRAEQAWAFRIDGDGLL